METRARVGTFSFSPRQAWAFYRRSTDRQEVSLEMQAEKCREKAAALGLKIVREFVPAKGYASGLTIDRDAAFVQMVRLAQAGGHGVTHLLVYNVSRFGRLAVEDKIYWEQCFKRAGIQVLYAMDDFKNDGSIGDVVTKVVKHQEAHEYSMSLSRVTLAGCLRHAEKGRSCGGAAPFGYARMLVDDTGKHISVLGKGQHKADKTQRVVFVPGDATSIATVRRIFTMFERGFGIWTIVDTLNKEGLASPRDKAWSKSQVRSLLQNSTYVGRRVYNKRDYKSWRRGQSRLLKPQEDWVVVENAHPALIDLAQFDRVQARFRVHKMGAGRPYHTPYLLSAKLRCACGHKYQGLPRSHNGKLVRSYVCGGYHNKGRHICEGFSFPTQTADDFVMAEIQCRVDALSSTDIIRNVISEVLSAELDAAPANLESFGKELAQVQLQISRLIGALKAGAAVASVQEELGCLEQRKLLLQTSISEEAAKQVNLPAVNQVAQDIALSLKDVVGVLKYGKPEERKACIAGFLHEGKVNLKEPGISFEFYKLPFLQKEVAERAMATLGYTGTSVKTVAGAGSVLNGNLYELRYLSLRL